MVFKSSLQSDDNEKPRANIGIVPLFPDKAASVPIVKHSLLLGKSLTNYLNPSQTPMEGMDHLIYAVRKHDSMEVEQRNNQLQEFQELPAALSAPAQHLGHHEEGHSLQMRFANEVLSVTEKAFLTTKWSS